MQIELYGNASKKTSLLTIDPMDLNHTVLKFLLKHEVAIAYSCNGKQVCEKCIINKNLLSCQITLKEFLMNNKRIEISYI